MGVLVSATGMIGSPGNNTYTPAWPPEPLPINATVSPLMQGSGGQLTKLPTPPGIAVLVSATGMIGLPGENKKTPASPPAASPTTTTSAPRLEGPAGHLTTLLPPPGGVAVVATAGVLGARC